MKRSAPRFEFVISAENNPYQVWQAMLFHFSCIKHQAQTPIVVVHKGDEPLLDGFERISQAGGRVQIAPNFSKSNGIKYPPRNTPAALRMVECDADYVIMCEPDMVFLEPLPLEHLAIGDRCITADAVTYLDPSRECYQPTVDNVSRRAGIDPQELRNRLINGGVPHAVPLGVKKEFGEHWQHGIELFATYSAERQAAGDAKAGIDWIASMWAVVLAVHRLRLSPIMTRLCVSNLEGHRPLPASGPKGPKIIHYCYGGDGFNKRAFFDPDAADLVWEVLPGDSSIDGTIRQQVREAREFFHLQGSELTSRSSARLGTRDPAEASSSARA